MPTDLIDNFDLCYQRLLGIEASLPQRVFLDEAIQFLHEKRGQNIITGAELVYLIDLLLKATNAWEQAESASLPSLSMRIPSLPLTDESINPPYELPHPPGQRVLTHFGGGRLPDSLD